MCFLQRHGHGLSRQPGPKGTGGERKAPSAPAGANPCPRRGLTRRLRREGRACSPMGRSIASVGDPKGCRGRAESPLHCIAKRQLCRKKFPLTGPDAPTPAREKGLQPYGALTLFFRWRKKSVQKKASGTATPGKRLLLPILTAGPAMSRAAWLASLHLPSCALGARLFPPPKWAGLFPSAAYRRSAPAQSAWGIRTPCKLGCLDVAGRFCGADKRAGILIHSWWGHTQPLRVGMFRSGLVFLQHKRPAWFQIHAGLCSEP